MFRRQLSLYPSRQTGQRAIFFFILALFLSLSLTSHIGIVRAANLSVNTGDDSASDGACDGTCTLRDAIEAANSPANPGSDTIEFDVSVGIITLNTELPPITEQVIIDGTAQAGGGCSSPIIIDGGNLPGDGILVTTGANASIIRGLTITGFVGNGIVLSGADNNNIQCNNINNNIGNGILLSNSSGNIIGGTGNENSISLNGGSGVNVAAGAGNTISANSIFLNGGAGDGITLTGGANNSQAAPVLTLAQTDGTTGTEITGTLAGTAGTSYTIEFFQCDSSIDEGEILLGTIASLTGAASAPINITLPDPLNIGDSVSATATNLTNGSTSAFSTCEPVIGKAVYQSNPTPGSTIPIGTEVGTPLSALISVSNGGNETLDITDYTLSNTTDFSLNTAPPFSIPNSGSAPVDIDVQCDATAVGTFTTILTVTHSDLATGSPATYTIECTVDSGPVPNYHSAPAPNDPITFGLVTIGSSNTANLIIDNEGSGFLNVDEDVPSITGMDAADFAILSGLPVINQSGVGSITVELQCTPSEVKILDARLHLTTNSNDPTETTVSYPLSCEGVPPVITITPMTLPETFEGDTYSATIDGSGGTAPYTFVRTGALPAGVTFDEATGTFSGTPDAGSAGTYNFSIVATDSSTPTQFSSTPQVYSLVVHPPITITTTTLPDGTVGTPYSQTIAVTGGTGTYNFTITSGSLPPPLGLNPTTGEITGTPNLADSYSFDVTVSDTLGGTATQSYTILINAIPLVLQPLTLTLPDAAQGTPYTFNFTATGGTTPYTFTAASALPAGLNLATDGTLSGTPTTGGTFTFDITVTDSTSPTILTDTKTYTLTVVALPPVVLEPAALTLPNGMQNTPYTFIFTATGGTTPYTFTTASALPTGLNLATDGTLSGTPTVSGTFSITVTVTDSTTPTALTDTKTYSLTIDPIPPVVLEPAALTLPNGAQNTPYTFNFTATGGTTPYSFTTASALPTGLNLATDGTLSGTPTVSGTFSITVTVTDSTTPTALTDAKTYSLTIDPIQPVVLEPAALTLPNGTQNTPYSFSFTATGGTTPYTFTTSSALPTGLNLATDGTLSGTPTVTGTFSITVTVTDTSTPTAQTDTKTYSLTINATSTALTINPLSVSDGVVNAVYPTTTISASGGTAPYSVLVRTGDLPPGINFTAGTGAQAGTGTLSGTPTNTGTFTFDITVMDAVGTSFTRTYTIEVTTATTPNPVYSSNPAPNSSTNTTPINVGTVQIGTSISTTLAVTNAGATGAPNLTVEARIPPGLITGANASEFSISTSNEPPAPEVPFSVQQGKTENVIITCTPAGSGVRVALLSFHTNDPVSSRTNVFYLLQCTGSGSPISTATPIGFIAPTPTSFPATATILPPANGTVDGVKGLAMRTGPYLGATLIGKIVPGQSYSILARSNDEGGGITWYLVITKEGVSGWVSGLYLVIAGDINAVPFQGSVFDTIDGAPDTGVRARAMSIIDIRRRPSGRATILGQVPQDGTLILLGRTRQNGGDFWVQVNYNGIIGWIPAAPIAVRGGTANVPIR